MKRIIVEQGLSERLVVLKGEAVLCDANGRALGYFSPVAGNVKVEDLQLEPPLSIAETEELRKREREKPGKPLEEILTRLGY